LKAQYKITMVVEELEEGAVEGLIRYFMGSVALVGAKPTIASSEIMGYTLNEPTECELCNSDVDLTRVEARIEIEEGNVVPLECMLCGMHSNEFSDNDNDETNIVGRIMEARAKRFAQPE